MEEGAPVIHDEPDTEGIYDAQRNIILHIEAEGGEAEVQWAKADHVFEGEYRTSQQQQAHVEPHVCITYWDEDSRLVVRSSTQVPFHVRRMLAPLIGLQVKQIRVIKPRIGGGFGNKQEMILEDLCAHLTLATGRPVRMEYTREQEFTSSRSRHPQIMRYKIGVSNEMEVVAIELDLIGDTCAYGTHGLTVQMVGGQKGLTLYNAPYSKFVCDVVYTNKPTPGAFRGYGAMQCQYGIEVLMDVATAQKARGLSLDIEETLQGKAFRVDNPNAPEPVRQMEPEALKRHVDGGDPVHLVDVRPADERARASIPGSLALEGEGMAEVAALPKDAMLVFYCHTGQRSQAAAEHFRLQGFGNVYNLSGGIDAWSQRVDPSVPRY